ELACADSAPRLLKSRIEAALEADLHAALRLLDVVDDAFCRLEVESDRLLAKHWETFVERAADQIGVGPGRCHDHRGIHAGEGIVDGRRVRGAELLREARRPRRVVIV